MASLRLNTVLRHLQGGGVVGNPVSADTTEFRYTLDNPLLSTEQRRFYETNGYIVFRNLINHDLLDECSQRFVDLVEGRVDRGTMTMMKDISLLKSDAKGQFLYYKVQDFPYEEVLSKYVLDDTLLDYVECFVGPNCKAMNTMLINKPPDSGKMTSVHPLHQDMHYFPWRPIDRNVAVWTAIEPVTVHNGCLVVIPGTHLGQLHPHDHPEWENGANKAYHGLRGFDHVPVLMLDMEKGDTVFFHPLLIHGSGINSTKGFRKAISCHYSSTDCHYIDVTGTSQESVAHELAGIAKQKLGTEISYHDFWKFRSRLVRGVENTL